MTMGNDNDLPRSGNLSAASGRSGPSLPFILLAVVVVVSIVFFLQNSEPLYIDFLVFEKKTTVRWSILMAIVLGALLDRAFSIAWNRRKKKKNEEND